MGTQGFFVLSTFVYGWKFLIKIFKIVLLGEIYYFNIRLLEHLPLAMIFYGSLRGV